MRPTWEDLRLYQIDLHFHAGTERPREYSLMDFVNYGVATGRRIIGVTDHFAFFLPRYKWKTNHYAGNLDGYRAFAEDVDAAKEAYPDEVILFGPEIGLGGLLTDEASDAFTVPTIDYVIGEAGGPPEGSTLGEYLVEGVEDLGALGREHDVPCILGHPLRWPILFHVGKTGAGPEMPRSEPMKPLGSFDDPRRHVEELLDLDISQLARAAKRNGVPVELNEGSWERILVMNHKTFAERYLFFYGELIREGVEVVIGSDLHNAEHGAATAVFVADMLGLVPRDMPILGRWLAQ